MIRAEIASTYPKLGNYTGQEGSEDNQGNKKDSNGDYVAQGIVEIHRQKMNEDGSVEAEQPLTYIPRESEDPNEKTLKGLIDANSPEALDHFSFDENTGQIYYAIYKKVVVTVNGIEDPERSSYKIIEKSASYKTLTSMCSMPYNFLFALLQTSQNSEYIMKVADLLLDKSTVILMIQDQLSISEYTEVKRQVKKTTTQQFSKEYDNWDTEHEYPYWSSDGDPTSSYEFPAGNVETTIGTTYENTVNIYVKKAETWCIDFEQEVGETPTVTITEETTDHTNDYSEEEYKELKYTESTSESSSTGDNDIVADVEGMDGDSDLEEPSTKTETTISYSDEMLTASSKSKTTNYTWTVTALTEKRINYERFVGLWRNDKGEWYEGCLFDEHNPNQKDVSYPTPGDERKLDVVVDNISDNQGQTIDNLTELLSVHEDTQTHEQLMKYFWNKYYGENIYDVNIDELLDLFITNVFTGASGSQYGTLLINWTGDIERDEFIDFMNNSNFAGKTDFTGENAGKIWDICTRLNINPVYCVSQAALESGWGAHTGAAYNYWGIGVFTDTSSGYGYPSFERAIEAWCNLILSYQNQSSNKYSMIVNSGQQAFGTKFSGDVINVYDVAIIYASLPSPHNSSCYGYTSQTFITNVLGLECNHLGSENVTDEEQAAYSEWYGDKIVTIAKDIFGTRALYGGDASGVVEYALQFEGNGHSTFTSYKTTTGWQFYGADWCAMFVSYCFDNCGLIPTPLTAPYINCTNGVNLARSAGRFRDVKHGDTYSPKAGDIIFYTKNGGATSYHTGIVIENDGVKVYTIEGNTGYSSGATNWSNSWVSKVSNSLSFANIYGYWEM